MMGRATAGSEPLQPIVILNPVSGSGVGHDVFRHAEHDLLDIVGEMEVMFTGGPGEANALVADALDEGPRDVIVVGGDGTINEVVNGWFDDDGRARSPEARLVLLGGGTGSDFVRTLGLQGPEDTCAALKANTTRRVDVGLVTCGSLHGGDRIQRRYLNIASFGLSSVVNQGVSRFSAMGGGLAYAAATVWSLVGWSNPTVRLTYTTPDDRSLSYEGPVVMGAFANGRFFGGGMMVAPDASIDDGFIDIVLIGDLRRRDVVRLARHLYDGSHVEHPSVTTVRAKSIEVDGDQSTMIEADGEVFGRLPATFTLEPGAITVVCP
jgi:diacylglycerol kinase (ATP)